jgi:hypothetical protein
MRLVTVLACALTASPMMPAPGFAAPSPGSAALVQDAGDWDGVVVSFAGEAIGEAMRRGDMAWVHLNDDAYGLSGPEGAELSGSNSGIGVWVDAGLASRISRFASYRQHGDVVEVQGVFHAACPQHGGDMDLHADSLRILRSGFEIARPVRRSRLAAAGGMASLAALLFAAQRILRSRRERRAGSTSTGEGTAGA